MGMVYQRPSSPAFQLCGCNALPILCKGTSSTSKPPTTTKSPAVHISVPSNRSNFNVALPALRDARLDPITSAIVAAAAVLGWLTGRLTSPFRKKNQSKTEENFENELQSSNTDEKKLDISSGVSELVKTPIGENAIWLNMSVRTLWRLFRKSTNTLTKEVLQPVLDDMELPDLVNKVTITHLTMGESPALLRKIKRLPSRSLNEIQYRFGLRLVGDLNGVIDMDVSIRLPGVSTNIVIPVSVSQLDIDSSVWVGFTVVPYKPWVRFAQWALVKMPLIKMKISVANVIPLSAVPVLSNVMNKIFTEDVPREFLFPKTQVVDLMGKNETDIEIERDMLEAQGVDPKMQGMSDEQLRASFPKLTAFFDSMDVDNDGVLNVKEVVQGLIEWGYASRADQKSIYNLLDVDKDGFVQLREFISVWGDLKNVFVPRRFRGVVTGVLLKAEGLRTPLFGFSNPYVIFSVEQQEMISKKNRETSKKGSKIGSAVWNESWELFVQHPRTAMLRVEVREGCAFAYYREYIAPRPKPTSHSGSTSEINHVQQANGLDRIIGYGTIPISKLEGQAQTLWVDLRTGGGRIKIDVQFSEFVDPKFLE